MTRILVLRPQPGADRTAALVRARGWQPIVLPLFEIRPIGWDAPDAAAYDALLMTSANAARHGGPALARYLHLPVYAVGDATAHAAREAGFSGIVSGSGDGAEIRALAGDRRLLHLAGREHVALPGVDSRIVYASEPVDVTVPDADIALLHSPRAARRFAGLVSRHMAVATLSDAVAKAAGDGWTAIEVAERPDDQCLLAAAARLCDQCSRSDEGAA